MENATTQPTAQPTTATLTPAPVSKPLEKVTTITVGEGATSKTVDIFRHTITKGLGQGNQFLGPDFTKLTFEDLISLHGLENALDFLRTEYRKFNNRLFKGAVEEAEFQGKDQDPAAIVDIYKKFLVEMSARGESKAELEEKRDEIIAELTKLAVVAAKNPAELPKFMELSNRLNKITETIESKSRERKPKAVTAGDAAAAPAATPAAA